MAFGHGAFLDTLKEAVSHNPLVNTAILSVLLGAMIYSVVATWRVFREESRWGRVAGKANRLYRCRGERTLSQTRHADPARRVTAIDARHACQREGGLK
jgi:hypothetical protein